MRMPKGCKAVLVEEFFERVAVTAKKEKLPHP